MRTQRNSSCKLGLAGITFLIFTARALFAAAALPIEKSVEWQPFAAQVNRLIEATDYLGSPFSAGEKQSIETAMKEGDPAGASAKLQELLDARCLFTVQINPEMRVKVAPGPAKPELVEQGWRHFLVKVVNDSGTTAALKVASPNAQKLAGSTAQEVPDRWLDLMMFDAPPLKPTLSGLNLE